MELFFFTASIPSGNRHLGRNILSSFPVVDRFQKGLL